jgi:hypothetical protein
MRNILARLATSLLAAMSCLALCASLSGCGSAGAASPAPTAATSNCTTQIGSFQLVATGFSADTVGMAQYKFFPCDHYALIFLPSLKGASNATSFTASPLPDFLVPATLPFQEASVHGYDNGAEQALMCVTLSAGSNVITYERNGDAAGWTPSGDKGVGLQVITVFLD